MPERPNCVTRMTTHETGICSQQPDTVKAFVSATAKGYDYAISNPDEAADILLKAAPETDAALRQAAQSGQSAESRVGR